MSKKEVIPLFYGEPDPDRWIRCDRFPRRIVRRIVRGRRRPGGQKLVFLNLCKGLRRLGRSYRINDYRFAKRNRTASVGLIGKVQLLDEHSWKNPILFGAATFSHPIERPHFFAENPRVKLILVPGPWMKEMWHPYYGDRVRVWPVGIDTYLWQPEEIDARSKPFKFLLYYKLLWNRATRKESLLDPIREELCRNSFPYRELHYGGYEEDEYRSALQQSQAMIFLCEHETQGIAYQEALSMNVPILAWDRQGYWEDPAFYPDKVKFGPVSSVPYWDERCGLKFKDAAEFPRKLAEFVNTLRSGGFAAREYILENLTLEKCAAEYVRHYEEVTAAA